MPATSTRSPRLLTDHPGYAAAVARLDELTRQHADALAELDQARADNGHAAVRADAEALIAGRPLSPRADLALLERRAVALAEAVKLQRQHVEAERRHAVNLVIPSWAAEQEKVRAGMAKALRALRDAIAEEAAFADSLAQAGLPLIPPLRDICFATPGNSPGETAEAVEGWLRAHDKAK